jgi:hypothetical protein
MHVSNDDAPVGQLVLIPLPSSDFVVPAMVRKTARGGLAAVIFGPAAPRAEYENKNSHQHPGLCERWVPKYLRKLRTTEFPVRIGLWHPVSTASPEIHEILRQGEAAFAQFVREIAEAPAEHVRVLDFAQNADLTEGPSLIGAQIYQAPENVSAEEAVAYLVGLRQHLFAGE